MDKDTVHIVFKDTGRSTDAVVTRLFPNDVPDIFKLQSEVMEYLGSKQVFVPVEEWELDFIFGGGGYLYGLRDEGKLLAFVGLIKPGIRDDNLGYDLRIHDQHIQNVSHLETAVVHPKARGNNIQFILARLLVNIAKEDNEIHYVANTVSPFNIPSIITTLRLGLKIKDLKEKYNGKLRYICCLDFAKNNPAYKNISKVESTDIEKQRELISCDYEGFSFIRDDNKLFIEFGREYIDDWEDGKYRELLLYECKSGCI
jgi:ribosomal protein S18 acetylase RimI-like enzyme